MVVEFWKTGQQNMTCINWQWGEVGMACLHVNIVDRTRVSTADISEESPGIMISVISPEPSEPSRAKPGPDRKVWAVEARRPRGWVGKVGAWFLPSADNWGVISGMVPTLAL